MVGASSLPLLRPAPPVPRPLPTHCHNSKPCPPCRVAASPASRGHGARPRGGGLTAFAGGDGNGLSKEEARSKGEEQARGGGGGEASNTAGASGGGRVGGPEPPRRRAALGGIRWQELLLDPDPDNVLAVGLTGLLAWASVQVLWQLFFISLSILLAALKYSFVAALLLFILITLL